MAGSRAAEATPAALLLDAATGQQRGLCSPTRFDGYEVAGDADIIDETLEF